MTLPRDVHRSIAVLFVSAICVGGAAAQDYVYTNELEQGDGAAPAGWETHGLGEWDQIGRTGRSLRISTWHQDGADSRWLSPVFDVQPGTMNLGVWATQNLLFAQDPGYCGTVAALLLDAQKNEVSRTYIIRIPKQEKRSFAEGTRLLPEGLNWSYYAGEFTVPPEGAYLQLVFAWSEFVEHDFAAIDGVLRGQPWIWQR